MSAVDMSTLSPQHRRSTSNTSFQGSTVANASPNQRFRNLSLPSHLNPPNSSLSTNVLAAPDFQQNSTKLVQQVSVSSMK